MISSLVTWYGYKNGCIDSFHSHEVLVDSDLHPIVEGDPNSITAFILDFDWQAGQGYLFVVVATLLKMVDVVCNLAVPTPSICRDHGEQAIYEVIALNRDADQGHLDEDELIQEVQRLEQSFRVMKEQSTRRLQGAESGMGGGNSASFWPRLRSMVTLPEEGEEGESSDEEIANKTNEKDEEDRLKALEDRLADELSTMDLDPSQHGTRRGIVATSVYF